MPAAGANVADAEIAADDRDDEDEEHDDDDNDNNDAGHGQSRDSL